MLRRSCTWNGGARRGCAPRGRGDVMPASAKSAPVRLWSVEDLLEGRLPSLADMAEPYTGKGIRPGELFE